MCRACSGNFPTPDEQRALAHAAGELRARVRAGLDAEDPRFIEAIRALDAHRLRGGYSSASPEWGHQETGEWTRKLIFERRDPHALTLFVLTCWYDMQETYPVVWSRRLSQLSEWIDSPLQEEADLPTARVASQKRPHAWKTWQACRPSGFASWFASTVNLIADTNPHGTGNLRRWIAALVLDLMVPGGETRIACQRLGRGIYAFAELKRAWMLTMFLRRDQGIIRCLVERSLAGVTGGRDAAGLWYDGMAFPESDSELPVDSRMSTLGGELFGERALSLRAVMDAAHDWGTRHGLAPSALDALFFSMD